MILGLPAVPLSSPLFPGSLLSSNVSIVIILRTSHLDSPSRFLRGFVRGMQLFNPPIDAVGGRIPPLAVDAFLETIECHRSRRGWKEDNVLTKLLEKSLHQTFPWFELQGSAIFWKNGRGLKFCRGGMVSGLHHVARSGVEVHLSLYRRRFRRPLPPRNMVIVTPT